MFLRLVSDTGLKNKILDRRAGKAWREKGKQNWRGKTKMVRKGTQKKKQKGEQTKENEENEPMIQVDIFIKSVQKPTSS
jgi:hypothetical protein